MGAGIDGPACELRGSGPHVAVRGTVAGRPRRIRTVEGWEVASLLVGPVGPTHPGGVTCGPDGGPILVVCSGAGARGAVTGLAVGEEVLVLGELVPRRAGRPEHDAVELVADTVLARRGSGAVGPTAAEPRIAP
ncbi:hypothetical protein ABID70_000709 [Clavibacter michiganensis]|uniref:hypothetical protein n=1 Tax=Clavibacter michiganensis TaxID=28447 RepID=UPI001AE6F61B|nr:hypothetical protein [Clavibacter michiganensis]MBP2458141.1 hypothetical protein [Clavibacter michiganensis]MDQ0410712.1 hypothetical protein [Clavibacter michiganensis]